MARQNERQMQSITPCAHHIRPCVKTVFNRSKTKTKFVKVAENNKERCFKTRINAGISVLLLNTLQTENNYIFKYFRFSKIFGYFLTWDSRRTISVETNKVPKHFVLKSLWKTERFFYGLDKEAQGKTNARGKTRDFHEFHYNKQSKWHSVSFAYLNDFLSSFSNQSGLFLQFTNFIKDIQLFLLIISLWPWDLEKGMAKTKTLNFFRMNEFCISRVWTWCLLPTLFSSFLRFSAI